MVAMTATDDAMHVDKISAVGSDYARIELQTNKWVFGIMWT